MKFARIAALGLALLAPLSGRALPAAAGGDAPGECAAVDEASVDAILDTIHVVNVDPVAVGALMEPDVRWYSSVFGELIGRDAVIGAFSDIATSFSDMGRIPEQVMVDEPYVVVRYIASGRQDGEYKGIAPTGNEVAVSGIAVYRLHCGMIAEGWNRVDQLGRLGQISDDYASYVATTLPSPEVDASCAPPTREDMETMLRQWYSEIWVPQPMIDETTMVAPNIVAHLSVGPDVSGIEAWRNSRSWWWTAFPDLRYRPGEAIVDGDLVATNFTAEGTDEGGFLGEAPTGRTMTLDGELILRVNCGKVVELWAEADIAGALSQLGTDGLR